MARIYNSSRTLLDPSLLQMANNTVNERLRRDAERRAPVVASIRDLLKSGAQTVTDFRKEKQDEEDYQNRYNKLLWLSSEEQRKDPSYMAALEESAKTGSASPIQAWESANQLRQTRMNEEQSRNDESKTLAGRDVEEWLGALEDSKTKGGITSIGNISKKDVAILRNKIAKAKSLGVDTTLYEDKLNEILEIPTNEPVVEDETIVDEVQTQDTSTLSTEEQNKLKADTLKKFKDLGAKLENKQKTLDKRDKKAVDDYNAEIDALQAEIDKAIMTNDVKLPAKVKTITKPTLAAAREGYKSGKYTNKQMRAWGWKYNDDIGDWE